ncbi:MAG: hypothetical protein K6B70_05175 [Clostridia bacterium]|nr:hypothetical protein [Clostridia bacterium]
MQEIPYNVFNVSADQITSTDTVSFIVDMVSWINGDSKRKHYFDRRTFEWKLKHSPMERIIIDRLLSFDFEEDFNYFEDKEGNKIKQIYYTFDYFGQYIFYYNPMRFYLTIMVQHQELLGKKQEDIIAEIKWLFRDYFIMPKELVDRLDRYILLSRIDFRRDYRYRDEQEFVLIKQIIDIAPEHIMGKSYNKVDEKDEHEDWDNFDDYAYMQKYKSESNETVEFVIYDKQLEQESKFRLGKTTQEILEQYKNCIRFEIRIKDKKLNNLKSDFGISKEFDNYNDESVEEEYFTKYAEQAFFNEVIYRLDYAIRLIYKSNEKSNMRRKLVKLLKDINSNGYTYTREHYKSISSFREHIKRIRALGINPLTFKQTWKDRFRKEHKTTYTSIPNFIQRENCLKAEDYIEDWKYVKAVEQKKKDTKAL